MRKKIALWVAENRGLPYRFRKSVVKRACPAILANHQFEIDFYGLRFSGNTKNIADRLFFMFGGSKKYMLALFRDYTQAQRNEGLAFIDVGAHVGNHALFMSKYAKKVHAFEPNQRVRRRLESNIELNGIGNIFVHSVGLGNTNEVLPFYVPGNDNFLEGSFLQNATAGNYYGDLDVRVGDDFIREKNIKNIGIIKIAVGGFERNVLEGMAKTIDNFRPLVAVELSRNARNTLGSLNDFESLFPDGYLFYQFAGVSREKEDYKLTKFDYGLHEGHLDVIAVPKEKRVYLGRDVIKKRGMIKLLVDNIEGL